MPGILLKLIFLICPIVLAAQTNNYSISFENAIHHEAKITATFSEIDADTLVVQMSRSSPGRYAIHEFAKNIYNFKATDGKGNALNIFRPDPYKWSLSGHNGKVIISYTLFANRGDGTYTQIDETHAHLNMPATFMFAPQLSKRKIEVSFEPRTDLNWKVATQLKMIDGTTYTAPDLQYFMDSPTEISDFGFRSFEVKSNGVENTIELAMHHNGTVKELNTYFESVKKVVLEAIEVFGELTDFDYDRYSFLACYVPNVSGDGMEHRNSTILTSTLSLAAGGIHNNISTVSHEFFHAWNVERLRPKSLEPFDFSMANMSGELWFAEGFTSYYAYLILCRAGLRTPEQYVEGQQGIFNYVWNSPARQFFNPIEMSYQAPFVDAATSIDPVNRENTFISYYSYGSVLGLALDLSLRQQGLNLDDFMKLVWNTYGKNESPYTVSDLHNSLKEYAGMAFGNNYFNQYVYQSNMPDFESLFETVGIDLIQSPERPYFGASFALRGDGNVEIEGNTIIGGPAYNAGLENGDIIMSINGRALQKDQSLTDLLKTFKVGDILEIHFRRFGKVRITSLKLEPNKEFSIQLQEKSGNSPSIEALKNRNAWLKIK